MTRSDPAQQPALRRAMANFATGLCIATTSVGSGRPHGATVERVMSASIDPPMILLSLPRSSALLARLNQGGSLGLNVLSEHQASLATRFSRDIHDRFAGVDWQDAGAPRLRGAHAWVLADVTSLVPAGDHTLVLADVLSAEAGPGRPLVYWQRTFGTHQTL